MSQARAFSGSAAHPDHGWVIAGGFGGGSSAEQTNDGKTLQPFAAPPLPLSFTFPCLVSLGKGGGGGRGDFFLTGGMMGDVVSKKAFIYDAGNWREMTDMPTARYGNKYKAHFWVLLFNNVGPTLNKSTQLALSQFSKALEKIKLPSRDKLFRHGLTPSGRGHVGNLPPAARIVDEGLLAVATVAVSSHKEEVAPTSSFAQRDEAGGKEGKWERGKGGECFPILGLLSS